MRYFLNNNAKSLIWVDLPAPSGPSKVINKPLFCISLFQCVFNSANITHFSMNQILKVVKISTTNVLLQIPAQTNPLDQNPIVLKRDNPKPLFDSIPSEIVPDDLTHQSILMRFGFRDAPHPIPFYWWECDHKVQAKHVLRISN